MVAGAWLALATARVATVAAAASPSAPELMLFDEQVVTTAAKRPQVAREAPSTMTVITREEIDRFGWRTLAETLRSVPGVYTSDDRNYSYLGVRGFLRPGDYNDRILILVNGHRYNDDVYGNALAGTEFGIDLEAIDHIEVVRGPGSALYGGSAIFAVINVITRTAVQQPGLQTVVETGSYVRKRAQSSYGHVFGNGAEVFASGSVFDVDGPHELHYPDYDRPATNHGIARDADGDQAYDVFASARWGGFLLHGAANRREKHVPTAPWETTFNDPGTKTVDGRRFAELQWTRAVTERLSLFARGYYDGSTFHGTYVYGSGRRRTKNEDHTDSDWLGGEARALWQAFDGNQVTLGGEYSYHPRVRQTNFDLPSGRRYFAAEEEFDDFGVYLQDEWSLPYHLTLTGGLRYDRYYGRLDHVSPRGALLWQPWDGTTAKLLYGNAFRPPNVYERYYEYIGEGVLQLANPDLQPEKITTYEAVLEQRLWRGATGTLSVYRFEMDDLIEQVVLPRGPGQPEATQYRNIADRVIAHGAEIELRAALPYGFRLAHSHAVQRASSDGGRLSNSPTHIARLALLTPVLHGLGVGTELVVLSPRVTITRRRVETMVLANVNFVYTTPVRGLSVTAGFYNLLDRTSPEPGGPELVMDRVPQNGFTFRFQVRYAW